MKPLVVGEKAAAAMTGRRRERLFYGAMAAALAVTVFAGFARTYYLRPYFGTASLPPHYVF